MIIKGSFDPETGRPYCQGLLFIPVFNKSSLIDFIVDTGSDVTTLNPGDGLKMKIDYRKLDYSEPCIAVGSSHNACLVQAVLGFLSDDGSLLGYIVGLHITPKLKGSEQLPSLLGTDVLRKWRLHWDPSQDILDFEPLSYDRIAPKGFLNLP